MTNFGPGPASWLVANMEDLSSPLQVSYPSNWDGLCKVSVRIDMMRGHTVDARNPAPPRIFFNPEKLFLYELPTSTGEFTGLLPSTLDF